MEENKDNNVLIGIESDEVASTIHMKQGYNIIINDDDEENILINIESKCEDFSGLNDISNWEIVENKDDMVTF